MMSHAQPAGATPYIPALPTPSDISQLLSRVALRDRPAFDLLYAHTSAKLFGVLLRLLRDRTEAEDALQEVYAKVWQRAETYAVTRPGVAPTSPISWLVAIARNHAIDRLRARKAVHEEIDAAAEIPDAAPSPEAAAVNAAERAKIDGCLDRLDPDHAGAVRAAYLEGYSYQDLAERYGVPLNTMRSWLRRSLLKLKDCMAE